MKLNLLNVLSASVFSSATLALLAGLLICPPACSQQSYKIGGTRVVGNSLARPADTYITRGTMSPSAQIPVYGSPPPQPQSRYPQGYLTPTPAANNQQQGSQQMGGLPNARMGATVGMPGDYMRSDLNPNYSLRRQVVKQNGYVTIPTQVVRQKRAPVATYGGQSTYSPNSSSSSTSTYGSGVAKEVRGY